LTASSFKILVIGDIVGKPGRNFLTDHLADIKTKYKIDFIIANGENSSGGFGITAKIARHFFDIGIDVITSGNHIWKNKDVFTIIEEEERLLKPLNYPVSTPGKGYGIYEANGVKVLVVNLLGRVNLYEVDCPFQKVDALLIELDEKAFDIVVVDFHAETTSEKEAMGWYLDGRAEVVVGTHTHVQTSDERFLHKETAYITDVGMTGSFDSVLGMDRGKIIKHFLTRMPIRFSLSTENVGMNSVLIEFDKKEMKPKKIERLNIYEKDLNKTGKE